MCHTVVIRVASNFCLWAPGLGPQCANEEDRIFKQTCQLIVPNKYAANTMQRNVMGVEYDCAPHNGDGEASQLRQLGGLLGIILPSDIDLLSACRKPSHHIFLFVTSQQKPWR